MSEEKPAQYIERLDRFNQGDHWKEVNQKIFSLIQAERRLLDVGCGTGAFLHNLQSQRPDMDLVGLDVSLAYLTEAQQRHPEIRFRRLGANGQFGTGMWNFDVITCLHVLGHTRDPELVLRRMRRALRVKGRLFLVVPNRLYDLMMFPSNLVTGYRGDSTILHHWFAPGLMRLMRRVGFEPKLSFMGETSPFTRFQRSRAWLFVEAEAV